MDSLELRLTILFFKTDGKNLLIVQVYVDDIISGLTNGSTTQEFVKLMNGKFVMSMMGDLVSSWYCKSSKPQ